MALAAGAAFSATAPARVVIIPFDINAQEQYSFLKEGIYDMLSTRMAIAGKTILVDRESVEQAMQNIQQPLNADKAVLLAEKLQADYVLYGSLTLFGNSISTDARFIDVHQKKPLITFNQTSQKHGDAIEHVDLLTDQIKGEVFGLKTYTVKHAKPTKTTADTGKHPDSMMNTPESKSTETNVGLVRIQTERPPVTANRSKRFKKRITGLTAGDVDGNGQNEVVFIAKRTAFVYQITEGVFRKIGEIQGEKASEFIGIDAADINENGKAEVFVTSLRGDGERLNSFVAEWNGGRFERISDDPNWYYRVINMPGRGKVLLGQQRAAGNIFKPGVFEMMWSNGAYEPAQQVALPRRMTVFGFTYGDALNNGRTALVAYNKKDQINISDEFGKEVWSSENVFGGNPAYLKHISRNAETNKSGEVRVKSRTYLPLRIHVADVDGNGIYEVITVKNKEAAGRYLERLRIFNKGRIQCLAWDGTGLYTRWKTHRFKGYISDYILADIDGDGLDEIVFSVVLKTGTTIGTTPKSVVYTLDMNSASAEG